MGATKNILKSLSRLRHRLFLLLFCKHEVKTLKIMNTDGVYATYTRPPDVIELEIITAGGGGGCGGKDEYTYPNGAGGPGGEFRECGAGGGTGARGGEIYTKMVPAKVEISVHEWLYGNVWSGIRKIIVGKKDK